VPFAPQRFVPCVQVVPHSLQRPPWQKLFGAHCCTTPHAGQLFWSMMQVSTPAPWHRVAPAVQLVPQVPHAPPLQTCVDAHALPHRPQFIPSVCAFTQAPPQAVRPEGHSHAQFRHDCPVPHAFPHQPQLLESVRSSTHRPLHSVWPV